MKIIFFGTPDFAIPSLKIIHQSNHNILCIITSPDARIGRGKTLQSQPIKKIGEQLNYVVHQPNKLSNPDFLKLLDQYNADLFIVVAFKILPDKVISLPKNGTINLHGSLLPKYRGAAPIQHAILNNEKETGVTTFFVQKEVDKGDILLQQKYNIDKNQIAGDIYNDLSQIGAKLLLETINKLNNNNIIPKKQDSSKSTFAPKIYPENFKINWNNSSQYIHNQIRAFSPSPGSYTFLNNKRIKLFNSKINYKLENYHDKIGCCINNKNFISIKTGDGWIDIFELQIEGKNKILAKSFLLGQKNINKFYFE